MVVHEDEMAAIGILLMRLIFSVQLPLISTKYLRSVRSFITVVATWLSFIGRCLYVHWDEAKKQFLQ